MHHGVDLRFLRGAKKAGAGAQRDVGPSDWLSRSLAVRQGEKSLGEQFGGSAALLRVLGEAGGNDIVNRSGNGWIAVRGRERRGKENVVAGALQGIACEWRGSGKHLVENNAERKKIGARVLGTAMDLLGAPVSGSAEQGRIGALVAGQARHAKVRELHTVILGDKDIGRFDVAVDYRAAVRDMESGSDVGSPVTGGGKGDAAFGKNRF